VKRVAHRTDAANRDLGDIAYQIGVESGRPLAADRIIDELVDCCEQLAALWPDSQLGTAASELGPDVRLFHQRRWVIIFRYIDDGVLVLRIVDGSQDYLSWKLAGD
jgi:plasmid stabilization system protein ParE